MTEGEKRDDRGEKRDDRGGEAGMTEGGGLCGAFCRGYHSFCLHSPVQSLFFYHSEGRSLSLILGRAGDGVGSGISLGGRGRVVIYGLLKDLFSWM